MNATTLSFDFNQNSSPEVSVEVSCSSRQSSMEQSRSWSMQPASQPSVNILTDESASFIFIGKNPEDDLLGEPFISTPDPSLSPSVFYPVSPLPSLELPEPFSSNIDIDMEYQPSSPPPLEFLELHPSGMDYHTSSELSLLPILIPTEPEIIDFVHPELDIDLRLCLPAFEFAFLDNRAYNHIIQQQSQAEYERSDRSLIYEEL